MIVVDTETTGTNPYKNSIIQIGAVDFYNPNLQFKLTFMPFDTAEVDPIAETIHKLSIKQLQSFDGFNNAITKFNEWVKNIGQRYENSTIRLGGYNIGFDFWFLKFSFDRVGIKMPFDFHLFDLYSISKAFGFPSLSVVGICNRLKLPVLPTHDALNDAIMTRNALFELLPKHGNY